MRVELLRQHYINDTLYEPGTLLDITVDQATPLMRGLDLEAMQAVAAVKRKIFGRVLEDGSLLDDPPIERPLEESQPVPYTQGGGPGR